MVVQKSKAKNQSSPIYGDAIKDTNLKGDIVSPVILSELVNGHTEAASVEDVRDLYKKLLSTLHLMQPTETKNLSRVLTDSLKRGFTQSVLEALILTTKSSSFNKFSSQNCLTVMRLLSRSIVFYGKSNPDKPLTSKQIIVFASTFELLLDTALKNVKKKDYYFSLKTCLMYSFSGCHPLFDKCCELVQNASENPKEIAFLALYLSIKEFEAKKTQSSCSPDLKLCSKSVGILCSSASLNNQIGFCSDLVKNFDFESFMTFLWPELKRTLTRHAEKALPSVAIVMKSCKIDFSEKIVDFFSTLFDFVISQSQETVITTLGVMQNIIKNNSQWEFLDKFCGELCSVFARKSDKKLNTASQKQLILDLATQLASNSVPESKIDQLAANCLISIGKLVKSSDALLLQCSILQCMLTWTGKISKKISPEFLAWLKAPTCNQSNPQTQTLLAKMCLKLSEKTRFEKQLAELLPVRLKYLSKQQNATVTVNNLHDLSVDLLLASKSIDNEATKVTTILKFFLEKLDVVNSMRILKIQPATNMKELIALLEQTVLRLEIVVEADDTVFSVLAILAIHATTVPRLLSQDQCPKTTVPRPLSQDHCPKTTVPRPVSQDYCPKTTVPRLLSQDQCPKATVPRPLSQDYCPKTTVPRLLSQDQCPKTTVPRPLSQDYCPKTTVPRLLSQDYCPKTTVPRPLSQDHCPKTTVPRPVSQDHCPKTTVPIPVSQDHCPKTTVPRLLSQYQCPKTTVPRLLSQDYCPKTSVPRLCRTKTALVQDYPKTAPSQDCPKTALSRDCPKTVLLQDHLHGQENP